MATFLYRCPTTGYHIQGFIADEATEERSDGRRRIGATARHRITPERRQSSDVVSADGALDFPVSASASSEPRSLPGRGFFFPTYFGESWRWVSLSDA